MDVSVQNKSQRIAALDVLRGFALLGILFMNIQSFSMPGAAYLNPTAYGDFEGINFWIWLGSHVFVDQKFMSIFSMLFGASVLLFCEKQEGKGLSPGKYHYRRTFWLMVFGLLHGYLFWYGDILFSYALCGFFVYLLRNKPISTLLKIAIAFLLVGSLYNFFVNWSLQFFFTGRYGGTDGNLGTIDRGNRD